jgi:hypothetical protein
MKRFVAGILASASISCAFAQVPSEKQQACNLLIETVVASTIWRDNNVPPSVAIDNLESALKNVHTPLNLWGPWHAEVWKVYGGHLSADDVEKNLRPRCH